MNLIIKEINSIIIHINLYYMINIYIYLYIYIFNINFLYLYYIHYSFIILPFLKFYNICSYISFHTLYLLYYT